MNYNKYVNNTGTAQQYLLPGEVGGRLTDLTLVPNGSITLSYPGLDMYVPHTLAKITENGEDISHYVVRARETVDIAVVEAPVEAPVEVEPAVEPVVEQITEPVSAPSTEDEITAEQSIVVEEVVEVESEVKKTKKARKI